MDLLGLICYVFMLVAQAAGSLIQPMLYRKAYLKGIKLEILMVYAFGLGWIANSIIAIVYERNEWRKLTRKDVVWAFLSAILGGPLPQYIFVLSLVFASSKQASIVSTIVPSVLYILGILLGLEELSRSITCVAKVVGRVLLPITCALLQGILNEGPLTIVLPFALAPAPAPAPATTSLPQPFIISSMLLIVGFLICFQSSPTMATWLAYYIQEKTTPKFVYTYTMAALMDFFGTLALMIYVVCRYHDRVYYSLGEADTKLVVIAFISVFVSVLATSMAIWCFRCKGKDYVASFSNLSLIIDTFAVPLFMEGRVQRGSLASVVLEIIGVRLFHWGQTKEAATSSSIAPATETRQIQALSVHHQGKVDGGDHLESTKLQGDALILNGSQSIESAIEIHLYVIKDDQGKGTIAEKTTLEQDEGVSQNRDDGEVSCNDLIIEIDALATKSNDDDEAEVQIIE